MDIVSKVSYAIQGDFTSTQFRKIIARNKRSGIAHNRAQFRSTSLRLWFNFFRILNLNLLASNKCN